MLFEVPYVCKLRDFHIDALQVYIVIKSTLCIILASFNFVCFLLGYPRPEITWFKDGIELIYHKFFQVHEWTLGNDTMKSKMEIDPTTQKDAGYYECQANNKYAIDYRGFRTDYVMVTYWMVSMVAFDCRMFFKYMFESPLH